MASLIVIKCGGSTMEQLPASFFETLVGLQQEGKQIVIVHGGGPAINAMLEKLNIPARFIDGLRYTCEQTIDVVEMVLSGSINKKLVRRLSQAQGKACGISGVDGHLIVAKQTERPLGLVGEIIHIDSSLLESHLDQGYIPVVAPLGVSADGRQVYNINADVAAGAIAASLHADNLLLITDVPGIMVPNEAGNKEVRHSVGTDEIGEWIESGVVYGGMIPKVQSALDALAQGVPQVMICQGTVEDLIGAFGDGETGTTIHQGS
ncbi:acetylglutamate kinase [Brevibacillus ginsengisoli]|uniref:acetylglutamate kinase n=1 Tax=Brevibacillus ginsengisoli TaxID=363854 RepID=UPI003CF05F1E